MRPDGAVVRPRTICWSLPQMLVETTFRITPCSHLRLPSASLGKSMDWTSTLPGPTYATPRLVAIECITSGGRFDQMRAEVSSPLVAPAVLPPVTQKKEAGAG